MAVSDPYPLAWESTVTFGGEPFHVRPLKVTDQRKLQEFFYSHTSETVYQRYFAIKRELSEAEAAHLCTLDYCGRMAFGVFENPGAAERFVAIGRYDLNRRTNLAETAIVVGERWRQRGIGRHLLGLLMDYARSHGIAGIRASILASNRSMVRIHRGMGHRVRCEREAQTCEITHYFDADESAEEGSRGPDARDLA